MKIQIVAKSDLNQAQSEQIQNYREDPAHLNDSGPIRVDYAHGMYAAVFESGEIFGVIEASGPRHAVSPGWWIASKYRGQRLGTPMAVALAKFLRNMGYTGAGGIRIQTTGGAYDEASRELKERFIKAFNGEEVCT